MKLDPDNDPADFLLVLLGGKAKVQAVSTAAALGLADVLADGERTLDQLATECGCVVEVLLPVLRLCTGMGFFASPAPDTFALTERGAVLRRSALGPLAEFTGSPEQWDPWSRLRDAARGGDVAFVRAHGEGLYDLLACDPVAAARYDAAIDAFTRHEAAALSRQFDFAPFQRVVDVGGGRGTLLAEVLVRWPHLRGILLDLPHVVAAARERLHERCGDRAEGLGGDFFAAVPQGADVYLLKHVLHNWPDDRALDLLRRCAAALPPNGRVVAIEAVLAADPRPDMAAMLDLEMQVLLGGRVRRKPELRRMFQAAGLRVERCEGLVAGNWLFVGARGAECPA